MTSLNLRGAKGICVRFGRQSEPACLWSLRGYAAYRHSQQQAACHSDHTFVLPSGQRQCRRFELGAACGPAFRLAVDEDFAELSKPVSFVPSLLDSSFCVVTGHRVKCCPSLATRPSSRSGLAGSRFPILLTSPNLFIQCVHLSNSQSSTLPAGDSELVIPAASAPSQRLPIRSSQDCASNNRCLSRHRLSGSRACEAPVLARSARPQCPDSGLEQQ